MESRVSYYEYREAGGSNIDVKLDARTPEELEAALETLRGPRVAPPDQTPVDPTDPVEPPAGGPGPVEPPVEPPPTTRQPYFDLGDGDGRAGEIISIPMVGGCRHPVNGFHIGIGLAGYGKFKCEGVALGEFLQNYLTANDMQDSNWSGFNMVGHKERALPTEWCDYAMAFFSIDQKRGPLPPIQIPVETHLFSFQLKILEGTPPGVYELSCKDEFYYTHSRQRRRDFLYTTDSDSEFASGGVTKVDCQGGTLTVVA